MTDAPILVQRSEQGDDAWIAKVVVNNPTRLNSLNSATMEAFASAFATLAEDRSIRAVVLTGAGDKAFIGGADITEMAGLEPESGRAFITRVHRCCAAVRDFPAPVIARIDGFCLGAGLEIAAACDLRVATTGSRFAMPEVKLGIPSVVEAALLPGLIGWGRTRRLLLLGETITASEALDWGLVEAVEAPDAIDAFIGAWLDHIRETGAEALRLQKALIRQWEDLPMSRAIQAGVDAFAAAWATDEPTRMMADFLEQRRAAKAAKP